MRSRAFAAVTGVLCLLGFTCAHNLVRAAQQTPPRPAGQATKSTGAVPPATSVPAPVGLENAWDVRTILASVNKDTGDLKPLLDGINPQEWYNAKGAPSTYILQRQSAQRQLNDVITVTKLFMQKTESLSLALDDYFRLEALDVMARSLEDGIRKYADRPTADRFTELLAHNFANRERLRDYIRDLAQSTEQNYKIADEEAQRCRGIISKEPSTAAKKLHK